jgi:hypothetical protein
LLIFCSVELMTWNFSFRYFIYSLPSVIHRNNADFVNIFCQLCCVPRNPCTLEGFEPRSSFLKADATTTAPLYNMHFLCELYWEKKYCYPSKTKQKLWLSAKAVRSSIYRRLCFCTCRRRPGRWPCASCSGRRSSGPCSSRWPWPRRRLQRGWNVWNIKIQ